ncbi:hypothetical protein VTJ49DRAFT_3137 [Mycothermus thermophilus]|uniref:Uncharacterized protein n=1 Tax=Humicola insolens TaxID=85995 RepID=A0ABR3V873_HUMIN
MEIWIWIGCNKLLRARPSTAKGPPSLPLEPRKPKLDRLVINLNYTDYVPDPTFPPPARLRLQADRQTRRGPQPILSSCRPQHASHEFHSPEPSPPVSTFASQTAGVGLANRRAHGSFPGTECHGVRCWALATGKSGFPRGVEAHRHPLLPSKARRMTRSHLRETTQSIPGKAGCC